MCGGLFKSEDLIESHHVKAKKEGGENKYGNLVLLHRHCHDQFHAANVGRLDKNKTEK